MTAETELKKPGVPIPELAEECGIAKRRSMPWPIVVSYPVPDDWGSESSSTV
jgi:hypothetical protein